MKITLDAIDGREFALRLPYGDDPSREHLIALHTTTRLRGVYEHDAHAIRLAPVSADRVVAEIIWQLAEGMVRLGGPTELGPTRLDLDLGLGGRTPAALGEARCESLAVPAGSLHLADVELHGALTLGAVHAHHDPPTDRWGAVVASLGARDLRVATKDLSATVGSLSADAVEAEAGAASLRMGTVALRAERLSLRAAGVEVSVDSIAVTGLRASRSDRGLDLAADELTLAGLRVAHGGLTLHADDARLAGLRYAPDGLSLEHLDAAAMRVALDGLGAATDAPPSPEPPPSGEAAPRTLGVDLPFLDLFEGRIHADTTVDVKVPVIRRRVARHAARLSVVAGAIDYRELEHGLSMLEDAILDFELEPGALVFALDALLAKKPLLRWSLDGAGAARAERGLVSLRTLLQPTLAAPPDDDGPDEGDAEGAPSVALRRIEVEGLTIEGALRGATTLNVAGGALRLGGHDAPALASLQLRGSVAYDAVHPGEDSELHLALAGLDLGVDGVAAGEGSVDVGRVTLGRLEEGSVTLRGVRPVAARAALGDLSLQRVRWRRPPA